MISKSPFVPKKMLKKKPKNLRQQQNCHPSYAAAAASNADQCVLCLWTDCVHIKHILLGIPSFVNQTKFRSNRFLFFVLFCFFFIKIVQNSFMFCLDVPTMSNTCAIVFLVCHMCAYLFFFSFWKYMYVFLQNKPLLYIPLYLHMIKILCDLCYLLFI